MENKNHEKETQSKDNSLEIQADQSKILGDNFYSEKKRISNSNYSPFTKSYNKIMFNNSNSKEKNPFDTPDHKRIFQSSNQKNFFNSNHRFDNSYGKEQTYTNPQFWLNNKEGTICINIFDSNYSEKKHIMINEINPDFVKKINFDNGELSKVHYMSEKKNMKRKSILSEESDSDIKKPEPRKFDNSFHSSIFANNIQFPKNSLENYDKNINEINLSDELKEKLANKKNKCNCSKSKCLKLYCECFANGELCFNCNCNQCENVPENEYNRGTVINQVKGRNPIAFQSKIEEEKEKVKHIKGCNCTKSGCLKKYCECFQIGASCTEQCRCRDCKNVDLGKPSINVNVRVLNENFVFIKKKALVQEKINFEVQKFKNFEKFKIESLSVNILDNSLYFSKKGANIEKKRFNVYREMAKRKPSNIREKAKRHQKINKFNDNITPKKVFRSEKKFNSTNDRTQRKRLSYKKNSRLLISDLRDKLDMI